jgi:hypothetical protein
VERGGEIPLKGTTLRSDPASTCINRRPVPTSLHGTATRPRRRSARVEGAASRWTWLERIEAARRKEMARSARGNATANVRASSALLLRILGSIVQKRSSSPLLAGGYEARSQSLEALFSSFPRAPVDALPSASAGRGAHPPPPCSGRWERGGDGAMYGSTMDPAAISERTMGAEGVGEAREFENGGTLLLPPAADPPSPETQASRWCTRRGTTSSTCLTNSAR